MSRPTGVLVSNLCTSVSWKEDFSWVSKTMSMAFPMNQDLSAALGQVPGDVWIVLGFTVYLEYSCYMPVSDFSVKRDSPLGPKVSTGSKELGTQMCLGALFFSRS